MNLRKPVFILCIAVLTLAVFYFSWLPDPDIGLKSYFPRAMGEWINRHGNLRTAIPFLFLGGIGEWAWVKQPNVWQKRLLLWAALLGVVALAEAGQLLLPRRTFDWEDIAWGAVGSGIGMGLAALVKVRVVPYYT